MRKKVLLVEDDEALRELLSFHLTKANFDVLEAETASAAWDLTQDASLIVLDWMLPDEPGIEWLRRFRQVDSRQLPVLMLTARASEVDKVSGLNAGADDYLVKPFSSAELIARLNALLRRTKTTTKRLVGQLEIDDEQGLAFFAGEVIQLTRREFDLLSYFAEHPGRVFGRMELLDRVWGEDFLGTDRTVDQHVAQLRAIIGADYIATVRGRGYRLVDPQD